MPTDARIGVADGADQLPSHEAIDNGNPTIYKPKWFVIDDINIDLISFMTFMAGCASIPFLNVPPSVALPAMAAIILPLRLFLPRPKTPEGLVLITGGSSGIGAELAYIFAEKGHDLILVGRNEEQLEAVKKNVKDKYGKSAYTISTDLSLPGSAKRLYDHVTGKGFKVDVLINGAGLGGAGDTFEQPIELTERMTQLNCTSLVQLSQLFGRDMISRGRGWMMQISSVGGKSQFPHSTYLQNIEEGWMGLISICRLDGLPRPKPLPRLQTLRPRLLRSALRRTPRLPWYRKHAAHARSHRDPMAYALACRGNCHVWVVWRG